MTAVVPRRQVIHLVGGQIGFEFGSVVWWVVLPVVAARTTNAGVTELSAIVVLNTFGDMVGAIPAGALVRRTSARTLLVGSALAKCLLAAAVLALLASGNAATWVFLVLALCAGLAESGYGLAQQIAVPLGFDESAFSHVNGRLRVAESVAQVGGSAVAGAVTSVGSGVFGPMLDVVASGIAAWFGRFGPDTGVAPPGHAVAGRLRTSVGAMWRNTGIRRLMIAGTWINFVLSVSGALETSFALRVLEASSTQLGLMFAAGSAGGVVGGLYASTLESVLGPGRAARWSLVVVAPFALLIPLSSAGWGVLVMGAGNAVVTFGVTVFAVASLGIRQRWAAALDLASHMAVFRWLGGGAVAGGMGLGVAATAVMSPRVVLLGAALGMIAGSLWFATRGDPDVGGFRVEVD